MSIQVAIKCIRFACLFFWHANGPLTTKINSTFRYLPIYHHHCTVRMHSISRNLAEFDRKKGSPPSVSAERYLAIMNRYFQLRKRVELEGLEMKQNLNNHQMRQSLVRKAMKSIFQNLSLFYESLQALVEGRREVLHNQDFIFEDGQSVKDKKDNFQKFVSRFMYPKSPPKPTSSWSEEGPADQKTENQYSMDTEVVEWENEVRKGAKLNAGDRN